MAVHGQLRPRRHRHLAHHGLSRRGRAPRGYEQARFDWLEQWTLDPTNDIIRTPGTESNVKEIYDACNELEQDPEIEIINQFSEFSNHLGHYAVTGPALGRVFEHATAGRSDARLVAFVSASGSAGTLGAGDYLKDTYGSRIVAVEALECPTMLENGFGDHTTSRASATSMCR